MTIVVSSSSKEIMANPARLIEAMRAGSIISIPDLDYTIVPTIGPDGKLTLRANVAVAGSGGLLHRIAYQVFVQTMHRSQVLTMPMNSRGRLTKRLPSAMPIAMCSSSTGNIGSMPTTMNRRAWSRSAGGSRRGARDNLTNPWVEHTTTVKLCEVYNHLSYA